MTTAWYEDLIEGPFVDVFREAMIALGWAKRLGKEVGKGMGGERKRGKVRWVLWFGTGTGTGTGDEVKCAGARDAFRIAALGVGRASSSSCLASAAS